MGSPSAQIVLTSLDYQCVTMRSRHMTAKLQQLLVCVLL